MAEQSKPRRWGRVVLAASLALNLLLIGIFAGAVLRHGGKGGHEMRGAGGYGVPYVRALPRDARRALHRAVRAGHPRAERRAAFGQMLDVLRAEPFEAQAARDLLAAQQVRAQRVQKTAQAKWLETVAAMTPAARKAYADRLEERLERGPRKRQRRD